MTARRILPQRREAETFDLDHDKQRFAVSVGYWPHDPQPAEVFIHGGKVGSDVEAVARDGAVLLSIAMQFGVPLDVIRGAITRNPNGTAMTIVGLVVDKLTEQANVRSDELARVAAASVGRKSVAADQGGGADHTANGGSEGAPSDA
jgi:hypothetical protein